MKHLQNSFQLDWKMVVQTRILTLSYYASRISRCEERASISQGRVKCGMVHQKASRILLFVSKCKPFNITLSESVLAVMIKEEAEVEWYCKGRD